MSLENFSEILCPMCVAERRPQRTAYDFRSNLFTCLVHGPSITTEFVHAATTIRGSAGEWWCSDA